MAAKIIFAVASALFVQVAHGQYIGKGSYVSGNSVVDNRIALGGLGGLGNLGSASSFGSAGSAGIGNYGGSFGYANEYGVSGLGLGGLAVGGANLAAPVAFNVGSGASGFGGQYVGSNSVVQGNSVVDNQIVLGGLGLGAGASGYGVSGLGGFALGGASVAAPLSFSDATLASLGGYNVVSGSPLIVTTISPLAPSGLAVVSENSLLADLIVSGQLPFLSAVAFEGNLATSGSGAASCGCGSGVVGINKDSISYGIAPGYAMPTFGIGPNANGIYF